MVPFRMFLCEEKAKKHKSISQLAARTCLAIVAGRMVAAWGAESLFGSEGMGYYSLFFVGIVYLLVSIASDEGATGFRLRVRYRLLQENQRHDVPLYDLEDRIRSSVS